MAPSTEQMKDKQRIVRLLNTVHSLITGDNRGEKTTPEKIRMSLKELLSVLRHIQQITPVDSYPHVKYCFVCL